MAIVSGLIGVGTTIDQATGGGLMDAVSGLFSGGSNGKAYRRSIRETLSSIGYIYNNDHPDAWNINKYGNQALENMVKLTEEYGDVAIQLHNNRELNDTIASNYSRLSSLAEQKLSAGRNTDLPGGNPVSIVNDIAGGEWSTWGILAFVIIGLFGFFFVK